MRLEPKSPKSPKEQLNNAPKRRSAQFEENKKRRFVNTQTCRRCLSPKRKTKETTERFCTQTSCHGEWSKRRKDEDLGPVAPLVESTFTSELKLIKILTFWFQSLALRQISYQQNLFESENCSILSAVNLQRDNVQLEVFC